MRDVSDDSLKDAWAFADASFSIKSAAEKKVADEEEAKEKEKWENEKINEGGIRGYIEVYLNKIIVYIETNPALKLALMKISSSLAGVIGPEGVQFVEQYATMIIIGFTAFLVVCTLFIVCAYVVPGGKEDDDVAPELVDIDNTNETSDAAAGVSSSGNEADGENDEDEKPVKSEGLKQRKKQTRKDT
jgi:hypothetical protein